MIGIFDSGFGGMTVFKAIKKALPHYDYVYLGDSLRAPYGGRSQDMIYKFTEQAVDFLFKSGCGLVILACNTASSEALRLLQQEWLPKHYPAKRILGVIRPVVEAAVKASRFGKIGVIGTKATVESRAYERELKHLNPRLQIVQQAAPLLVPLIEEGWLKQTETRMILKKYLRPLKNSQIDTLILGCTHYPLLMKDIERICGKRIKVLDAPKIVAEKLADYLNRHPEIKNRLSNSGRTKYLTTNSPAHFDELGGKFLGSQIKSDKVAL